jgi:hypothetical protein
VRLSDRTSFVYEMEASRREVPFDRGVLAVNGQLGLIPFFSDAQGFDVAGQDGQGKGSAHASQNKGTV